MEFNRVQALVTNVQTRLTVASFNLCNFGIDSSELRLQRIAHAIVQRLQAPALVGLQEIKGSELPNHYGRVTAHACLQRLCSAIADLGGPQYQYCEAAPEAGADGGLVGANIRCALLYDPNQVQLVPRGHDLSALDDSHVCRIADGAALSSSPGRVAPRHPAFAGQEERHWAPSRKALAAEFSHQGRTLFVLVCHLKSMRADTRRAEDYAKKQRHAQAEVLTGMVSALKACAPQAGVLLLGDCNDVPGSKTLKLLRGSHLHNPAESLIAKGQWYSRRHGGRPQALDHILHCTRLQALAMQIPHLNSDVAQELRCSDHDPISLSLEWKNIV